MKKGAELILTATGACVESLAALSPLEDVRSRKLFGGYGLFENGAMFALLSSEGIVFPKADDNNRSRSEQHGRMPYFAVPATFLPEKSVTVSPDPRTPSMWPSPYLISNNIVDLSGS